MRRFPTRRDDDDTLPSLHRRFPSKSTAKAYNPKHTSILFDPKEFVAVDVESTGVDVWGQRLVMGVMVDDMPFAVSMCDEQGNGWYCEWPVDPFTRAVTPNPFDVKFINDTIKGKGVIFHNSKFDCRMLAKVGVDIVGLARSIEDTLFMARVTFTLELSYGLKFLAKKFAGIGDEDEKALQDAVKQARMKARRYNTQAKKFGKPLILVDEEVGADYWLPGYFASIDPMCSAWAKLNETYCKLDTYRTMVLFRIYTGIMEDDPYLRDIYDNVEMRKVWYLVNAMEERGLRVYPEAVIEERNKCIEAIKEHKANMEKMIHDLGLEPFSKEELAPRYTKTGRLSTAKRDLSFNPGSSKQILRILYLPKGKGGLGIPVQYARKGPRKGTDENIANGTASQSADKDILRELMYEPFVQELVGYRGAAHTKGLFFDSLLGVTKDGPSVFIEGNGRIKRDNYRSRPEHRRYEKLAKKLLKDWYVHPSFNQCGTKAGRFSAGGDMGINPQQATAGNKKSLGGGKYSSQKVFGPRPGYVWVGLDYSQQEGRIFAELAQVRVMLDALYAGEDLFHAMAEKAWGGKDNPKAFKAGVQALELFKDKPSDCSKCEGKGYEKDSELPCKKCEGTGSAVGLYWKRIGWSPKKAKGLRFDSPIIAQIVDAWLAENNYSIIAAEAVLGKEAARQRCKHITYAKIFGGGPGSYTHLLYCTLEEAKEFDREYNEAMPEMKRYMKALERQAERDGFIINLYGRKLRVDRNYAYRAVSYMIQGSAADMMKASLIKIADMLTEAKLDAHIVLTIHDEIKIEIRESQLNSAVLCSLVERMEDNGGRIKVPMPVGVAICRERWSVNEEEYTLSPEGLLQKKDGSLYILHAGKVEAFVPRRRFKVAA